MIHLWDVDSGLSQIDKYLHSTDNHVVAGALLGVGIVNCGIKNDCDPVLPLSLSLSLSQSCSFSPTDTVSACIFTCTFTMKWLKFFLYFEDYSKTVFFAFYLGTGTAY
jgi:hypothetical protein